MLLLGSSLMANRPHHVVSWMHLTGNKELSLIPNFVEGVKRHTEFLEFKREVGVT